MWLFYELRFVNVLLSLFWKYSVIFFAGLQRYFLHNRLIIFRRAEKSAYFSVGKGKLI